MSPRGDRVFVLGDFSFHKKEKTEGVLARLNGQKFLVKGNHDHTKALATRGFAWVKTYYELKLGEDTVVLSNFPLMSWHQMHKGSYHLHGHCHGTMQYPKEYTSARILDVGVDAVARTGGYAGNTSLLQAS